MLIITIMTIIINFIGSPSVGKTVMTSLLFAELKLNGYLTEYVQEYIKHLIWKNDTEKINDQMYVSTKQYQLFKNINGKVEFIVTDGSLIHGLYYNRYNKNNTNDIQYTETKIKEYINEFENIYIFIKRGEFPYETQGRIHTYEQSLEIEKDLEKLLQEMNLNYIIVDSSKESIGKVMEYIEEYKFSQIHTRY